MPADTSPTANFMGSGVSLTIIPTRPGFRSMDWQMYNPTTLNRSPYTGQQQVQASLGGEAWRVTCHLPAMRLTDAPQWRAWLLSLQGRTNVFQLYDQRYPGPAGNVSGSSPLTVAPTAGINQPLLRALTTTGWLPNIFGALATGDYIQVGYRLYMVIAGQDSDGFGNMTIPVWPPLREAPPAGTPVTFYESCGVFRLLSDTVNWTLDSTMTFPSLTFAAEEYR